MSLNKLFAVLHCQPRTRNRLRGEARNGRRAIYVDRSRRPDGDLRDKPGCVPASGCTKGAPWRATRCIGADGSPVGGAQQRRPSPYLVSQEEKPSKSARGAGPPGTRKARRARPLGGQNTHCPGTPRMPSHGRRRQEHPVTQSLRHCAWCFPVSGAAVQQAGGHGGRTQSEYSESSPSASGFARHCTPPR